jgi:hypothetical protein
MPAGLVPSFRSIYYYRIKDVRRHPISNGIIISTTSMT